ncbi:enoyl-CoA hydratase [Comamonas sp. Z3]|uniref:enoyl-CoA hydratase n=1 Tax=Comamonas sp. Z3 TaxID=2601247 RepID=UPI0011E756B6|nr:enoyl-CoA hydratase [Comamonas sp. Z3]TYK68281.1 enoyl-CoA hydratase [Comamonas sp. Z3]
MNPDQSLCNPAEAATIEISADGIATVQFAAGGPLNIISSSTALSLAAQLRALAGNDAVRVVVFKGAGTKTFVGGADIRELAALAPQSARRFIAALSEMCEAARDLPVPSICALQGWCIGVGLEFAASCDLRIAADDARFVMPEVKIGTPSVIQGAFLSRLIGEGQARWLMLTGEAIDAQKAQAWGLVSDVVPRAQLEAAAQALATSLAALSASGMRAQKRVLRTGEAPHLDGSIRHSIEIFGTAYESADPANLMGEFLSRKGR